MCYISFLETGNFLAFLRLVVFSFWANDGARPAMQSSSVNSAVPCCGPAQFHLWGPIVNLLLFIYLFTDALCFLCMGVGWGPSQNISNQRCHSFLGPTHPQPTAFVGVRGRGHTFVREIHGTMCYYYSTTLKSENWKLKSSSICWSLY